MFYLLIYKAPSGLWNGDLLPSGKTAKGISYENVRDELLQYAENLDEPSKSV
jgi:hypothetical protein